jgi:hypothetical protein
MRRNILVTAIAVVLTIGSGSLQASSCGSCRRGNAALSVREPVGASLSGWQQFILLLPIAFTMI